jgi:hypothetical protein
MQLNDSNTLAVYIKIKIHNISSNLLQIICKILMEWMARLLIKIGNRREAITTINRRWWWVNNNNNNNNNNSNCNTQTFSSSLTTHMRNDHILLYQISSYPQLPHHIQTVISLIGLSHHNLTLSSITIISSSKSSNNSWLLLILLIKISLQRRRQCSKTTLTFWISTWNWGLNLLRVFPILNLFHHNRRTC